ncbi:hypothetical protein HDU79_011193 [Rhizoclosmatium sp. JEL0117]|nr:hypothetical protein HDU79_011193 [Rhizoclosmatium sp. JEL0117]
MTTCHSCSILTLPPELLEQIIIHLPIDNSLIGLSSASKHFFRIMKTRSFARMHLHTQVVRSGHSTIWEYLDQANIRSYRWKFLPLNYKIAVYAEMLKADDWVEPEESVEEEDNLMWYFRWPLDGDTALRIFQVLIGEMDVSCQRNRAVRWMARLGCLEAVKLLLGDERVDPSDDSNYCIQYAAEMGRVSIVRLLLKDPRVNPCEALEAAASNNQAEVVQLLLTDRRVNQSDKGNISFAVACDRGYSGVVQALLKNSRVPTDINLQLDCLTRSSMCGHADVVELLLKDSRVDPSFGLPETSPLVAAAEFGHVEIVKLLLADLRINPACGNNMALRRAEDNWHQPVIDVLLADERVIAEEQQNLLDQAFQAIQHLETQASTSTDSSLLVTPSSASSLAASIVSILRFSVRPTRDILQFGESRTWAFVKETGVKFAASSSVSSASSALISQLRPEKVRDVLDTCESMSGSVSGQSDLVFVKLVLVQQSLHLWLKMLVDDETAPRAFYEPSALMRDKEAMYKLIDAIEKDVSSRVFHFNLKESPVSATLPNPAPLIHTLSQAATNNASALAHSAASVGQSAFSVGQSVGQSARGITHTASSFATSAFGFGLTALGNVKESLDSQIVTLNLGGARKNSVDGLKAEHQARGSVSTAAGSIDVGIVGVVNDVVLDDSEEFVGLEGADLVEKLKLELKKARKQAAEEKETRLKLQTELISVKHARDREVNGLMTEIGSLKRQLEDTKQSFHGIDDI